MDEEEEVQKAHHHLLRDVYLTPVIAILAFLIGGTVQKIGDVIDTAHERKVQNAVLVEGLHQLRVSHEQVLAQLVSTQKALVQVEGDRVNSSMLTRDEWTRRIDLLCQNVGRLQTEVRTLNVRLEGQKPPGIQ